MTNKFPGVIAVLGVLLIGGCAGLPEPVQREASYALSDTADTTLAQRFRAGREAHPGQSGLLLLPRGVDAFLARAVLAQAAERSIDAQYYLLHRDVTGLLFLDQLVQAADRGVRVRLLVDDMDLAGTDPGARSLDDHPNIEVRIFNPFRRDTARALQLLSRFGSVTRRMHNKSFTVDGQVTVVGGRNIGDEYFEADPVLAFGDLDVLAVGPAAAQVSASFDRYWNHPLAYPVEALAPEVTPDLAEVRERLRAFAAEQAQSAYLVAVREAPLAGQLRRGELDLTWGRAEVVADDPDKFVTGRSRTDLHLASELAPHVESVQRELTIFSPYFVPGDDGVALLRGLRERGVRVRILTNSLASTDVAVVHAGYARYRKALLRAGVELYEANRDVSPHHAAASTGLAGSSKASLHAKSFVLDRRTLFIGSLNLDPRSVVENSEIGLVVESPLLAGGMADWFDRNIASVAFRVSLEEVVDGSDRLSWHGIEQGRAVRYPVEPHTALWERLLVGVLRLLPIESQL